MIIVNIWPTPSNRKTLQL